MKNQLKILGLGLDYNWLKEKQIRGNFSERLESIASNVSRLTRIVFTPKKCGSKSSVINYNVETIYTSSKNKLFYIVDAITITRSLLKKQNIDLISSEDPFIASLAGILISKIFHLPLNIQINHDRINNAIWLKENKKNFILNLIANLSIRKADSLRVVSERVKTNLIKLGIKEEKIFVIPSLIMADKLLASVNTDIRAQYVKKGFKKIILFVGRLSKEKDIPTLLKAFKKILNIHPKTLLLIVGDGPERSSLENLAQDLNIFKNLDFIGPIEHSEINRYYISADIFTLTSCHEGSGDVLVEAALLKKPIISTDVGDARNMIIDGESGFIVKVSDIEEVANKVIYLLNNPKYIEDFGNKSFSLAMNRLEKYNNLDLLINCWQKTKESYKGSK